MSTFLDFIDMDELIRIAEIRVEQEDVEKAERALLEAEEQAEEAEGREDAATKQTTKIAAESKVQAAKTKVEAAITKEAGIRFLKNEVDQAQGRDIVGNVNKILSDAKKSILASVQTGKDIFLSVKDKISEIQIKLSDITQEINNAGTNSTVVDVKNKTKENLQKTLDYLNSIQTSSIETIKTDIKKKLQSTMDSLEPLAIQANTFIGSKLESFKTFVADGSIKEFFTKIEEEVKRYLQKSKELAEIKRKILKVTGEPDLERKKAALEKLLKETTLSIRNGFVNIIALCAKAVFSFMADVKNKVVADTAKLIGKAKTEENIEAAAVFARGESFKLPEAYELHYQYIKEVFNAPTKMYTIGRWITYGKVPAEYKKSRDKVRDTVQAPKLSDIASIEDGISNYNESQPIAFFSETIQKVLKEMASHLNQERRGFQSDAIMELYHRPLSKRHLDITYNNTDGERRSPFYYTGNQLESKVSALAVLSALGSTLGSLIGSFAGQVLGHALQAGTRFLLETYPAVVFLVPEKCQTSPSSTKS